MSIGVNMVVHDAICECFEGTMLEPCLLELCFHVTGETLESSVTGKCLQAGLIFIICGLAVDVVAYYSLLLYYSLLYVVIRVCI